MNVVSRNGRSEEVRLALLCREGHLQVPVIELLGPEREDLLNASA
jgi:hypothetical protein